MQCLSPQRIAGWDLPCLNDFGLAALREIWLVFFGRSAERDGIRERMTLSVRSWQDSMEKLRRDPLEVHLITVSTHTSKIKFWKCS